MLALRRLSPLLLLAAALLALAVLFAPGAQPAQAQTSTVWSATLTVKDAGGGTFFGCNNSTAAGKCSSASVLTDDDFTYDNVDYEIPFLAVGSNTLGFRLNKAIPATLQSALTLNVGSTQFPLADGTLTTSEIQVNWSNPGLSWSIGDTISLSLTEALPPGTVWSPTLTAKNIPSPDGTASAAFGCQANASGADCTSTSVLTDDDFTYDGVDYAVTELWEANNTIVFGLDRAIPQRLRAATLTAAGTALSFADATYTDGGATVTWSNTGLDWSADTSVSLSLTAPIPPARSAPDEETVHWSETLTVQELDWGRGLTGLGCGYKESVTTWCSSALTNQSITYHGATYSIEMVQVAYSGGTLQFVLSSEPKDEDGSTTEQSRLVLRVGSGADAKDLRVADALVSQGHVVDLENDGEANWTNQQAWVLSWTGTGLSWNAGDSVSLSLVTPPVGGL